MLPVSPLAPSCKKKSVKVFPSPELPPVIRITLFEKNIGLKIVQHFKGETVDLTTNSMIIQISGNSDKIDAVRTLCEKFSVKEYIRTGKVIMVRGDLET